MQSGNKSIVIIVAALLVAAFFMPWIKFFVGFSGWDIILGDVGNLIESDMKYVGAIIPLAGGLIIYGAAFNNEKYAVSKKLLFALPILSLLVFTLAIAFKISESGEWFDGANLGDLTKIIGIGFWLTLIASVILPNLKSTPSQPAPPPQNETHLTDSKTNSEQPASNPVVTEKI